MLCAKINYIMDKNPTQTTALTFFNQTQPRMHENMIIMLENAMYVHVRSTQQNPTQKF